jgi:hypothetical protein
MLTKKEFFKLHDIVEWGDGLFYAATEGYLDGEAYFEDEARLLEIEELANRMQMLWDEIAEEHLEVFGDSDLDEEHMDLDQPYDKVDLEDEEDDRK